MTAIANDARVQFTDLVQRARQEVRRLSREARNNTAARFLAEEIDAAEAVAHNDTSAEHLSAVTDGLRDTLIQAGTMPVAPEDRPSEVQSVAAPAHKPYATRRTTAEKRAAIAHKPYATRRTTAEKRAAIAALLAAQPNASDADLYRQIGGARAVFNQVLRTLRSAAPEEPETAHQTPNEVSAASAAIPITPPDDDAPAWLAALRDAPLPCGLRREKLLAAPDVNPLPALARRLAVANVYQRA